MGTAGFFHPAFISIFCLYVLLRGYFKIQTKTLFKTAFSRREGFLSQAVRVLLFPPLFGAVFAYCFFPGRFPFLYLSFPPALRGFGLAIALLALAGLGRVHYILNDNFTASVEVRRGARLVTRGPYRRVRHPMYALYTVFFFCAFLLSENWVIGFAGAGVFADLMFLRLPYEERELEKNFGDEYRAYRAATKRFVPGVY
jgi:protein-S-isoprenylcysteine O-methyltransferase Ste14